MGDSNGFALNTTDTGAEGDSDMQTPMGSHSTPQIQVQKVTLVTLIPTRSL